jgi:pyruvate dehydrogenase E1 component alpha subunit
VTEAGALSDGELNAIDAEVMTLIEEAVEEAKAAPFPEPDQLTADVYVSY